MYWTTGIYDRMSEELYLLDNDGSIVDRVAELDHAFSCSNT